MLGFWRHGSKRLWLISQRRLRSTSPPAILAFGYGLLVLVGSGLLKLDAARTAPLSWLEAFFTATSAVTVTGLVVVDTGSHFTLFGQLVIAFLIQAGGLGFMTFAILTLLNLGRRLGLRQQLIALEAFNQTSLISIRQVARSVLLYAGLIELIGWLLLTWRWSFDMSWPQAAYQGFFYTISAFNNAGFALSPDSLSRYVGDIPVNLIITLLFIIGGLGFVVLQDVTLNRGRWRKLRSYSRLMILGTLVLNLICWALFFLFEYANPATLGRLPLDEQLVAAWFQAVTPRTAGFNTLPIDQLTDASSLLTLMLMFIGGGSVSTASGIKLGTIMVVMAAVHAFLRQHDQVTVGYRSIPQALVMKALAVMVISSMLAFFASLMLAWLMPSPLLDCVFEVVSALGTVGLSRGLTGQLTPPAQLLIMLVMFAGRLGPLTLAYVIAVPKQQRIKYPKVDVLIG